MQKSHEPGHKSSDKYFKYREKDDTISMSNESTDDMNPSDIEQQLRQKLPDATISVQSEDHIHFVATIVSQEFRGLSRLAQHRKIYGILQEDLKEKIHALQLITKTPEEA